MAAFQRHRGDEPMISVDEAQRRILNAVRPLETERVPFLDAAGRILRQEVRAVADLPEADNSAMDGYAICAADAAGPEPVELRVIGDIPAGVVSTVAVERGTAVRIMTGAHVPSGADAVVQVEWTDAGTDRVRILRSVPSGANIRRRGEDIRRGDVIFSAGTQLAPADLGVLASMHQLEVEVGRRPVVAVLPTGDELIEAGGAARPGAIVSSSSYALAAHVVATGGVACRLPIVPDDRAATVAAIESALDADFIVSTGGVSVGAFDFVKDALDDLGADTEFWRVAMKPGKPVVFARVRETLFFGLPGNPVSSLTAYVLFVAPALRKATGMTTNVLPPVVNVRLTAPLKSKGDRRLYARVRVVAREGELEATPMKAQGSGVLSSMVQANAFAIIEEGLQLAEAGSLVPAILTALPFSG